MIDKLRRPDPLVELGAHQTIKELVQRLGVPVAIHITFAKPQIASRKGAIDNAWRLQLNIPRPVAVDRNIRLFQ